MTLATIALLAATSVYRLELTDEVPYIVGEDGVRREVCLVDPAQYAMMTGQVAQVWKTLNATEDGRVKLHGARASQAVTNGCKVTVYRDGYRYADPIAKRTKATMERFAAKPPRTSRGVSARQKEMLERIAARKTREVTVEHNAATGKDEVK